MTKKLKRTKTRKRYSEDLKRKVAKSYLSGEASYGILAEENGLKNRGVVREFVKWYRKELLKEELPNQMAKPKNTTQSKEDAELHHRLELAELKIEMLETMIDLAEKQLNIDIRKKSGTNQ